MKSGTVSEVNVLPNPFCNHCVIKFQSATQHGGPLATLKIYDVSGLVVKSFNLESCIMDRVSNVIWMELMIQIVSCFLVFILCGLRQVIIQE